MTLSQTDLLAGMPAEEAEMVLALGSPITVPAGGPLFRLGEPADHMYLVVKGRIALTLPMKIRGAEEDVLVEEKMAGEALGWSGLIPPHRFTLKASAAVETKLIAFSRAKLLEFFAAHPTIGYAVTRNVAGVIGHRRGIFQTMWLREMQRVVELRYS